MATDNEPLTGRTRVVIDYLGPEVDRGRFPAKRALGETVIARAHAFGDGHDEIRVELLWRRRGESDWQVVEMDHRVNDEWYGDFDVTELGTYEFTARGWVDHFGTWRGDLKKKYMAGQDVRVQLQMGSAILLEAAGRATGTDQERIAGWARQFEAGEPQADLTALALQEDFGALLEAYPDRSQVAGYPRVLEVAVGPARAAFSTWYELFPRSCGPGYEHGTLRDVEDRLAEVAGMGFDVLYLPPIHPIGHTHRKGKNNSLAAREGDPGSPWAIGSEQGGHKAVHPQLGTVEDVARLAGRAAEHGIALALDLAFQCSQDHPYVKEHPEWFRWRPDGTVQFAENPPKRYEDIIPLNFETENWRALWEELRGVVLFWIEQGVTIFRVDNPHTKPFGFWEWLIMTVKEEHPETIFLAEAFTRPKVMERLAKIGFDQSYTYFTWRNTKWELEQYMTELTRTGLKDFFRPNFWPNTPDILPEYLQYGGRPAFIIRLVLAATLAANYGMYGPALELCVSEAVEGKEEYFNSEKYEIKNWDLEGHGNIRAVVERVNRIRRENPALQQTRRLWLCEIENEMLLCYAKANADLSNLMLVAVNLDPHHRQNGWVRVPVEELGIEAGQSYLVHDELGGEKYIWQGEWNYVELDPQTMPAHVMRIHPRLRRETDFDYFM